MGKFKDFVARNTITRTSDGRDLFPVDAAERRAIKNGLNPSGYERKDPKTGRWVAADDC